MVKVYGLSISGNCYKVKLLLEMLKHPYEWVEVDTRKSETRSDNFLERNPNGKVPLLELEDGTYLPESNAILYYMARDSDYFPEGLKEQACVLQWMFFEQYSHEPYIATNRWMIKYLNQAGEQAEKIASNHEHGIQALGVMEKHLNENSFFVADRFTIADIALFAYTHVAEEGKYDLHAFPAIMAWMERIKKQPGYIDMFAV